MITKKPEGKYKFFYGRRVPWIQFRPEMARADATRNSAEPKTRLFDGFRRTKHPAVDRIISKKIPLEIIERTYRLCLGACRRLGLKRRVGALVGNVKDLPRIGAPALLGVPVARDDLRPANFSVLAKRIKVNGAIRIQTR